MFTQKERSLEENHSNLSGAGPTHEVYQGEHCWGRCPQLSPALPSPSDWGSRKSTSQTEPLWTKLTEASKACEELLRCGCHPDKGWVGDANASKRRFSVQPFAKAREIASEINLWILTNDFFFLPLFVKMGFYLSQSNFTLNYRSRDETL